MRRDRLLPLVATMGVLALVQVMGSLGASQGQTDRRGLDAVAVALLLVGPAAVALRDRHVAALVAFAATTLFIARGHPYGPAFASPLYALFTAGLTPHRRRTIAVAAVGAVTFLVGASLDDWRTESIGFLHVSLVVGWFAAVPAVAEVVRSRRVEAEEQARQAAEADRRRAGEQRLRIAQELHDVLAHDISLINVQAGVALHLVDEQPEQARTALANIKEASRDALQELRSALEVLRTGDDVPRTPAPGLADLANLVAGVRAGGLDVVLDGPGEHPPLPGAVELAAYRIVQEALTNVTRHAGATRATVVVRVGDEVELEVTDDGVGGAPVEGSGIGGMRNRATSLGGSLDAGPVPGGFRVAARIPA